MRNRHSTIRLSLLLATVACVLGAAATARAAAPQQKTFPTPEAAATALVDAVKANDLKVLIEILGGDAKPLLDSGDPVADEAMRAKFVASYDEAHAIVDGPDDTKVLQTGKDDWPLPIPLVYTANGWRFDTAAGQEELLNRRVGRNELAAIQTALAYVDAQREYYAANPLGEKIPPYAQALASSPGKKDGLYWDAAEGEPGSPLGAAFASARAEGYRPGEGKPIPFHGYYFRILKAQGPNAPGGKYDYVVKGKMVGGFALVAYAAEYGASGVMTFIVSHDGVVYEKDLGPGTAKIAQQMKAFDPDESWRKVEMPDAPSTPTTATRATGEGSPAQ
ncbi:MAG: DUF2950 domain-containing protein [Deltaproteobacteria bacterium]|nr:DUF2950 domain-containing protein [Deltaproteobacteria bacterium]